MPNLKKNYDFDLLVEVLAHNCHVDDAFPDYLQRAVVLVVQLQLNRGLEGPPHFEFLWCLPALTEDVPGQILEFINFGADAKFQSEKLLF